MEDWKILFIPNHCRTNYLAGQDNGPNGTHRWYTIYLQRSTIKMIGEASDTLQPGPISGSVSIVTPWAFTAAKPAQYIVRGAPPERSSGGLEVERPGW